MRILLYEILLDKKKVNYGTTSSYIYSSVNQECHRLFSDPWIPT